MGILFALMAMVGWGVGDFLIQRSTRKSGNWTTIFAIGLVGTAVFLPFVFNDLPGFFKDARGLYLTTVTAIIGLLAAVFYFEALRKGKISVIEPILAFEIVITVFLALTLIKEGVNSWQIVLIFILVLGMVLVGISSRTWVKGFAWETGVVYAVIGMVGLGVYNFLAGVAARETSPLFINWVASVVFLLAGSAYLIASKDLTRFRKNKGLLLSMGLIDNMAWLAYTYSVLYIPIAIAVAISESYIALAAALGLMINREKLKPHQFAGLILSITSAVILAVTT